MVLVIRCCDQFGALGDLQLTHYYRQVRFAGEGPLVVVVVVRIDVSLKLF